MGDARGFLKSLFTAAVRSALAENCLGRWLPPRPAGRVIVVGAGKASAAMAAELEKHWGDLGGLVLVPHGHVKACRDIEIVEAAHPVPDTTGLQAAGRLVRLVSSAKKGDTVVCLFSGGGSSLLTQPADGVSFEEKQAINRALLNCGAPIHEINCVRKKLSAVKGGKLAAAAMPADVLTLVISDIPGNDAAMVASGPSIADTSAASDAIAILRRYNIEVSGSIRRAIEAAFVAEIPEPDVRILATSDDAQIAAASLAMNCDVSPYTLGDLGGDARQLGEQHARLALQIAAGDGPVDTPCVILSGGETTVNVCGNGRGGRNSEYALALACALNGHPQVFGLACDTDGIDGTGDNAGCFVTPDTLSRANALGLDAQAALVRNDSYSYFHAIDDLLVTGPTRTNVNDFRAILVGERFSG